MKYLAILLVLIFNFSCASTSSSDDFKKKGRHNKFVSMLRPLLPKRLAGAYNHTLYDSRRATGDCQPNCPKVDIWQYKYLDYTSSKPISTQKAFWKSPKEARIIAFSLFGTNPIYYQGLLEFLESFKTLKRVNQINDKIWGFDTFTPRVYIPKRNPNNTKNKQKLTGELEDYQIKALLDVGCEIVYVDNHLQKASKDATFWRFMIAAEPMPEGQKIRYLLRDADWIMTGPEAFTVGEWMASSQRFHRTHLVPICLGPLTASWWGGMHTGKQTEFLDLKDSIEHFPYRLQYGDDELFLRDIMWPHMKASGSILTHYTRRNWKTTLMNPYEGSCEEPTKHYCNAINPNNQCIDSKLPSSFNFPSAALGFRKGLAELEKNPDYFDMKLKTPRGKKVNQAFSI